jgi:Replication-relaxation
MSGPRRVRLSHVERLVNTLSTRDVGILETLSRVRIASGSQLERLHFSDLGPRSRQVKRWQVLKRLTEARALMTVERRIGATGGGSDKQCYILDSAGLHVLQLQARASGGVPIRRPRIPGDRFLNHALAVTELYVALVERSRLDDFRLEAFEVEPRWPNGVGGWLGPDAYVQLAHDDEHYSWWFEADLGTESLPTLEKKLTAYLDFVQRGRLGPGGVVPWVLIGVQTEPRQTMMQRMVNRLPELAGYLFRIGLLVECTILMEKELIS